MWQILHDGKIDDRQLDVRVPYFEGMIVPLEFIDYTVYDVESVKKMFASFPSPRVIKTHLTYEMTPKRDDKGPKPKYIYAMRNPKDAFVSLYHLRRDVPYFKEVITWDEAFKRFMDGKGW